MSDVEPEDDKWSACPPNTLTAMAWKLKCRQRRNRIQRIALMVAAVLITVAAGSYVAYRSPEQNVHSYAGITCHDVGQMLPDYIAGKIEDSKRLKIEAHLELCPYCRGIERRLRDQQEHSASVQLPDEVQVTALERN